MLKRNPSLTLRAAFIFLCIYGAIFVGMLMLMSRASLSVDGDGHHSGPNIGIALADEDLRRDKGAIRLRKDGRFAAFSEKNPSMWLIGQTEGQRFSFGPVPPEAFRLFDQYSGILDTGKFHVPGVAKPLSDSVIRSRQTPAGTALLAVGGVNPATLSLADGLRFFFSQGLLPLLTLGGVGLLAMLLTLPLVTRALRRVAADAAAIRPDRPDRRIEESSAPRELLPLVRGFNSALTRLSNELARRKRFIADVAHELRTPLAITSLQVDGLPDGEGKRDLQRVMNRMSHLVAQMLDVERLSLAEKQRSEIDLAALASDVIADMAPMAIAAGYEISLEAPREPVQVEGDSNALGRAIGNLIGNAVAHGGGDGQIQVVVGAWRTLDVIDEGPGVPPSLQATLFEPFSRERWDRDGCGLGLHLTREIMRAHGGDAVLLKSSRGAAFRLEFPKASVSSGRVH